MRKFTVTLLKGDSKHRCFVLKFAEFLRSPILKNTAFIRRCFDTIILMKSGFPKSILLNFWFQNENINIISKINNLKINLQYTNI